MRLRTILIFVLCLASGCASLSREPQTRPDVSIPKNWVGQAAGAGKVEWPDSQWWTRFQSVELNDLIDTAQRNNYDVKAAVARVAQARANVRVASSGLYPGISGAASVSHSKSGDSASVDSFSLSPQLDYEIDIWGKNRFTADAAKAGLLSTAYAGDVVRLSLTADVAAAYFQLLSLNDRLKVAQDNLDNARSLMSLVETQKRLGKVSGLEVERQRTQVATTESAIPPVLQQIRITGDALAVLLGENPGDVKPTSGSLRSLPLPEVEAGMPSGLLERRPDIRKAEEDLVSASANIGAARAAMFPSISLSGRGGFASTALSTLFDPGSAFYSVGANLLAVIFDGGRLSGQVDLSKARKDELIAVYHQSILSAFRDVEDSLAGIEHLDKQEKILRQSALHAREAYRLAETAYRLGQTDFTTVLDAQRTMIGAEAAIDPVLFARFTALVNLYRALGGGWEDATARTALSLPE